MEKWKNSTNLRLPTPRGTTPSINIFIIVEKFFQELLA